YSDILAAAVAQRLATLDKQRESALESKVGAAVPDDAQKAWIISEFQTKHTFYRALQAIDLWMKAFTDGVVKDPDAVLEIKQMLDGTPINTRWFNENTGDAVWKAFESVGT